MDGCAFIISKQKLFLGTRISWQLTSLSRCAHLDTLTRLAGALVVVVECRPGDNVEWRRRLESRGAAVANGGGGDGWHKPKTWAELERLLEGYQGCTDYEIEDVPRIVVDTTDPAVDAQAIAEKVVVFVRSHLACSQPSCGRHDSPVCY
jgi:hypothetical protein